MEDAKDDLVPDSLSYDDFKSEKAAIISELEARVRSGYTPSGLLYMDVPKGNLTLRPGAVPILGDRLVYTALAGAMADRLDRAMEPEDVVPSYRVRVGKRRKQLFKFGVDQWFKFQELTRAGYSGDYRYLLATDLTAYFDHIDHNQLMAQLRDAGVPERTCDLLRSMLRHWSGRGIGIPQGLDPSSLLGNFYLNPLDKHMRRAGFRFFRYVDDIRVFGRSRPELQRAMIEIIHQTRSLGLHVQTAKTRIYENDEVLRLVDDRRDEFETIDYDVAVGLTDTAVDDIRSVLAELLRPGGFNERHFRKCLNSLRRVQSSMAVKATLRHLDTLAPHADQIARYLAPFVRSHPSIRRRLIEFLMDDDRRIYEWVEFWFIWTLRDAVSLPRPFLDWCRARVQTSECHWNCRGQYALILGRHGDIADKNLVQSLVPSRENDYERRAFIVALKDLPDPQKTGLLQQLATDYPDLNAAVRLAA